MDVLGRLLNPGVLATMVAAGAAYGVFLWALDLRPNGRLWAAAVVPGVIFLLVIFSIRGFQGTTSIVYLALTLDWLIFANVGVLAVLGWRRWRKHP